VSTTQRLQLSVYNTAFTTQRFRLSVSNNEFTKAAPNTLPHTTFLLPSYYALTTLLLRSYYALTTLLLRSYYALTTSHLNKEFSNPIQHVNSRTKSVCIFQIKLIVREAQSVPSLSEQVRKMKRQGAGQ
jgi:hypothetical protein